ncbi:MAG: ATP-grasp domain-containing protein [Ignavibacteria bacterium]|nr:ATP-grasp domain-containing protein [Ignavibacteria bacterium]
MKVVVLYNEPIFTGKKKKSTKPKSESLDFDPVFSLEEVDPIEEYKQICNALKKFNYEAYTLNIQDDLQLFMRDLEKNKPDVIFNFVELFHDQPRLEMNFTGLLELLNIPYTGATPNALGTCQNKTLTKRILDYAGIRTPKFKILKTMNDSFRTNLRYPLIVKPAWEDASVGIDNNSIVNNVTTLKKRVEYVFSSFKQPALVEEFILGRELNVAVFGYKDPKVLPISEIDFSELPDNLHPIVSFQAKWDPMHEAYHKTIPICPAPLNKKIQKQAEKMAIICFKTMGCRDYARVDMRLSKEDNKLYVLEVNPNPDLTEDAGFMRSSSHAGYDYATTLKMIVDYAYERKTDKEKIIEGDKK